MLDYCKVQRPKILLLQANRLSMFPMLLPIRLLTILLILVLFFLLDLTHLLARTKKFGLNLNTIQGKEALDADSNIFRKLLYMGTKL